jgi:hypothetical protein
MQLLMDYYLNIDTLFWGTAVLIHLLYWLICGPGSILEGIGHRFFKTIPRSIVFSEAIGSLGLIINVIFDSSRVVLHISAALFVQPFLIIFVWGGQGLKHAVEAKYAAELQSEQQNEVEGFSKH